MARGKRGGGAADERVHGLALRFAAEVQKVVRDGVADEVRAQLGRILEGIARGGGNPLRLALGAAAGDRRIGKAPVPVQCPAPHCKSPGIRAKRNFCADHAASLSESEKARFRDAQLARRGTEPRSTGKRSSVGGSPRRGRKGSRGSGEGA